MLLFISEIATNSSDPLGVLIKGQLTSSFKKTSFKFDILFLTVEHPVTKKTKRNK